MKRFIISSFFIIGSSFVAIQAQKDVVDANSPRVILVQQAYNKLKKDLAAGASNQTILSDYETLAGAYTKLLNDYQRPEQIDYLFSKDFLDGTMLNVQKIVRDMNQYVGGRGDIISFAVDMRDAALVGVIKNSIIGIKEPMRQSTVSARPQIAPEQKAKTKIRINVEDEGLLIDLPTEKVQAKEAEERDLSDTSDSDSEDVFKDWDSVARPMEDK